MRRLKELQKTPIEEWKEEEKQRYKVMCLVKGYEKLYKKKYGFIPDENWGKYTIHLRRYAEEFDVARVVMAYFFNTEDSFIEESNHSIAVFCSLNIYNKLKAELIKNKNPILLKSIKP